MTSYSRLQEEEEDGTGQSLHGFDPMKSDTKKKNPCQR